MEYERLDDDYEFVVVVDPTPMEFLARLGFGPRIEQDDRSIKISAPIKIIERLEPCLLQHGWYKINAVTLACVRSKSLLSLEEITKLLVSAYQQL